MAGHIVVLTIAGVCCLYGLTGVVVGVGLILGYAAVIRKN